MMLPFYTTSMTLDNAMPNLNDATQIFMYISRSQRKLDEPFFRDL